MSNATPPFSLRAPAPASGSPLRGTVKGVLATLVLLLLALLFWQLLDQLQQTRKDQRQHAIDYNADLAEHISLNLALNAQIALNLLPIVEPPQNAEQQQLLLKRLQLSLPDLQSIALLDAKGQLISDSGADGQDAAWLAELTSRSRGQRYYYSNATNGALVQLLLHQPSGALKSYWVLRLAPSFVQSLQPSPDQGFHPTWVIENRLNQKTLSRDDGSSTSVSTDDIANSVLVAPWAIATGNCAACSTSAR